MNFKNFLNLPEVEKQEIIKSIEDKKNPIKIKMSGGTEMYLSYDEFKRIKPKIGEKLKVFFQRDPKDKSKNLSKIFNIIKMSLLFISAQGISLGGTIDPGIADSKYVDYGSKFKCVTKINATTEDGKRACASAVVIKPRWIVTAAHVVKNTSNINIEIDKKYYKVKEIFIHKDFEENNFGYHDISLGYLEENTNLDFYPELYSSSDEENKVAAICGYGVTGNFINGSNKSDGLKRAGSNKIDYIDKNLLMCSASRRDRTALEFLISHGDSGGGLFIDKKLAGINSCVLSKKGSPNSKYEDESGHTRVSIYRDWIIETIELKEK